MIYKPTGWFGITLREIMKQRSILFKMDIKKLPIKQVSISKPEDKFLDRFFGFLPFWKKASKAQSHEIMAILPL